VTPAVGYAGMTHLGLVSASAAAASGFRTVAFDPDAALIGRLMRGDLPVNEPGLSELIERHSSSLAFSADITALGECDVVYIAVDVPTDERGDSDLGPIAAMV
jgi:UDPglucose 6-dehydrogenase